MLDIIQNPMFIAIIAGTFTYLYMWWTNEKRYSKNPDQKKPVNIYIPAIVTFVTWALVYGYYTTIDNSNNESTISQIPDNFDQPKLTNRSFKLMNENRGIAMNGGVDVPSDSVRSFQLVGKGLNIPNNLKLPDVFIETY
jgi:hypothetical protein